MSLSILFLGIWDIPVSSYWIFYLALGLLGFAICYYQRLFIIGILPVLIWFAISDFERFYRYQVSPSNSYVFSVSISICLAICLSLIGTYFNWKKQNKLK